MNYLRWKHTTQAGKGSAWSRVHIADAPAGTRIPSRTMCGERLPGKPYRYQTGLHLREGSYPKCLKCQAKLIGVDS